MEYRWADFRYERLPALAAELVARPVNVIFTTGSVVSSLAAKASTSTIPIVFANGSDLKFWRSSDGEMPRASGHLI
jgi:putative tryptophan/tyrosine transport system substrate-binding protein